MKKITFKELPEAVANLYGKIECIEILLKEKDCKIKNLDEARIKILREKCSSSYNKSDLAQLFYILMDEKILFFDDNNEKYNRGKIQLFVEENFTYMGDGGLQTSIDTISKQFSECKGFIYKEKQIKFLDNILRIFQKRRDKLIDW
ncbi:hypothetical protein FNW52_20380 [Flavobacterium sp. ZT3R18]|uniref:hypothetical protein n=1 Tax=Flavobacterium sp. ZT3R18 TaxID=2594429 RepID=UPI001179F07B|nr:hypothetical protein [Flavobacterium sp. ZT3R18]TRX30264.1 hypothetical protein FNW52_20380 [Flavobacterium sp. ZT3R18]